MRISALIARRGFCSRRQAEKLIKEGLVKLEGLSISSLSLDVDIDAAIEINGEPLSRLEKTRLWRFYKPRGVLSANIDPSGRKNLFSLLPKHMPRVVTIGRLDMDSEGLMLLTNDGVLARHFELPSNRYERVYLVKVDGIFDSSRWEKIRKGVVIGNIRYRGVSLSFIKDYADGEARRWLNISLYEGKNHEVRKLLGYCGFKVLRLIRKSFGEYELGDLRAGQVKEVYLSKCS